MILRNYAQPVLEQNISKFKDANKKYLEDQYLYENKNLDKKIIQQRSQKILNKKLMTDRNLFNNTKLRQNNESSIRINQKIVGQQINQRCRTDLTPTNKKNNKTFFKTSSNFQKLNFQSLNLNNNNNKNNIQDQKIKGFPQFKQRNKQPYFKQSDQKHQYNININNSIDSYYTQGQYLQTQDTFYTNQKQNKYKSSDRKSQQNIQTDNYFIGLDSQTLKFKNNNKETNQQAGSFYNLESNQKSYQQNNLLSSRNHVNRQDQNKKNLSSFLNIQFQDENLQNSRLNDSNINSNNSKIFQSPIKIVENIKMQKSRLGVSKNKQENLQTKKIDVTKFNKFGKKVYKQISEKKNFTYHNKLSLLNKMDILREITSKQNVFGLNKQQKKVLNMFDYARYESIKSFQNDQIIKPIDFYNGKKIFVSKIFLLKKNIQKMIELLESKIKNFSKRNDIDSVCKKLLTYAQQSKNQILICVIFISYAKLQIIWKNFPEAIEKLKHLKNIIKEEKLLHYKMIAYYQLGKCFSEIQRHNLSLVYFGKSLRLAWSLDDIDQEIKCYDFIGLQMYYLNKLVEAKYFHQRMIQGKYEEFDSDQRNLSKSKIKNKLQSYKNYQKLNLKSLKHKLQQQDIFNNYIVSSSEDEFDIPVNNVDHENQENDLTQNYKLIGNKVREIDGESSQFDLLTQNNRLQQGFMNQQKVKANKNIRMIADQQRELQTANEYYKNYEPGKYKIIQKNRDDFDPVQRQSHLSINRNPNNFQKEDGRTLKLNDQEYNKVIYDSLDRFSRKNIMIQLKKLLSQFKFCNDLILNSGDLKIDIEKYSALYEEEQNKILENRKKIRLMENEEGPKQQFDQLQNSKQIQKLKPSKDDLFEVKKELMQQSFVINSTTSLEEIELKKKQSNQQQKLQLHSNPLLIQSANINVDQ